MINFDDFNNKGVKTEKEGLPKRPVDDMVIIKHDARIGALTALVSIGNSDEEPESVNATSIQFVPLLTYTQVSGKVDKKDAYYTSALTSNNFFDVYGYGEDAQKSLGIISSNLAYDKTDGATSRSDRVFGILRAIDGKNPMEYEEIKKVFGSQPIVPCFIDLKYNKAQILAKEVTGNWSEAIKQKIVTINGGNGKELAYTNKSGQKNYHPAFKVEENEKVLKKMQEISQDFLQKALNFADKVEKHDEFISTLYEQELTAPGIVNTLSDLGVTDMDSLDRYLQKHNNDWNALHKLVNRSSVHTKEDIDEAIDKVDDYLTNDNKDFGTDDLKKAFDDESDISVDEDELPF